jgi:hypothetical protein
MSADQNSQKVILSGLLLKLHKDNMTGVVTVKDSQKALRIYLKGGHVVYAEGIDKDSQLIKEIATKKKLDQAQLSELKTIKEKDPHSLGETLIQRKLISKQVWDKFLELKIKNILATAFKMETADLGFSAAELNIAPINYLDSNIVQLLLDTIRGIKDLELFKKHIPGDNTVFTPSEDSVGLKINVPLSPSEQSLFSMIDGQKTVEEIKKDMGMEAMDIYKILYLFLCFDLIKPITEDTKKGEDVEQFLEIINLYLDLLRIIETYFKKEVGREFENIFDTCRGELPTQSKEIFQSLNLSSDLQKDVIGDIVNRITKIGTMTEGRLLLLSSFNKLIFLLLMRMKKVLGIGLAESTLNEMMNILQYVEKYRQDAEMMNYIRGNLEDYLNQIKS